MTIYITRQSHHKFSYLLNWHNPETGSLMGDWFHSLKEILEYTQNWPNRQIVKVNF